MDDGWIDPTAQGRGYDALRRMPDNRFGLKLMDVLGTLGARFARYPALTRYWEKTENGTRVLVAEPIGPVSGPLPLVLYLHGGGYVIGAPEQALDRVNALMEVAPALFVIPKYTRAFDAPYPAALDDAEDALLWALRQADNLGVRTDQVIVAGESAGGGLAVALSLRLRKKGKPRIAALMPYYPMLDPKPDASFPIPDDKLIWSRKKNAIGWGSYLRGLQGPTREAVPARNTDWSGLPPTFSYVGTADLFLRECRAYYQSLEAAGVRIEAEIIDGAPHAAEVIEPASSTGQAALDLRLKHFAEALETCTAVQDGSD